MEIPKGFKLPSKIKKELPQGEVDKAREVLWEKSGLVCSLCDEALPSNGEGIEVDHVVARMEGEGGETKLGNLYLAHKSCNGSRQNMPFDLARSVIRFQEWCKAGPSKTFADVVEEYLDTPNQRIKFTISDDEIELQFKNQVRAADVFVDPATDTKFFFTSVPASFIQNDAETQPRRIEHDHVRALAVDFSARPVHEPSNCRLVPATRGLADLLQFDGQHKTSAQIILGRTEIPTKVYIKPAEPMLQTLVVQIQQGIKKRPLSTSDTLRKLDVVVRDKVEAYRDAEKEAPNEIELIEAQPKQDQTKFKKTFLASIEWAIFNDDDCLLKDYASTRRITSKPFTDRTVIGKLLKPLVSQELLDDPLDAATRRDHERQMVLHVVNRFADNMLTDKWNPQPRAEGEDLQTRRARNFFKGGAIGFWLSNIFVTSMRLLVPKEKWNGMFLQPLSTEQDEKLDRFIDTICEWPIWSTEDEDELAALRSNTVKRVTAAFPDYSHVRLIEEVTT